MRRHKTIEHHDTILESINEGVFTVDLNWRIVYFNRAAANITGVPRDKAIGRHCYNIFKANICENDCALKRTLENGKPIINVATQIINCFGGKIPIRISAAPLKDNHGNMIGGVETFQDITQIEQLKKELEAKYTFEDIIGRSPPMRSLFHILPQVAESDSTVLIEGGSGTGKELFAKAVHNLSKRKKKPFVAVNCGALPDTLLESELFGYEAGAFTGAKKSKPGRFAIADGGTLFLDEIGDITPAMQSRLLRVLQEKIFEPLGAVNSVRVDVRVLAATNKDLGSLMNEGKFRDDLYYRIQVIRLKLPALKDRREDLPLLIDHLVGKFSRLKDKNIIDISDEVRSLLMEHDYPGNIRELENIIEHACVLCSDERIEVDHLPPEFRLKKLSASGQISSFRDLRSMERYFIEEALRRHKGNRKYAAMELGIDTSTLYRKIKRHHLQPPSTDGRRNKEKNA
ncbi:MAG: sigma 54-interacting transcriptional regulator [Desulfobacterales bacterium]|nr:sigma 54-interacting transcriptional regulator [Desulfobacterales bacterium]MBS3809106.1 sigma 54-interacting transcriptional regulator [Desulfobacterales bacterium]